MKHIDDIRTLIRTLYQSPKFHALVIKSPPGFAKSTTVEKVLREISAQFVSLGSYSTALELYNFMCTHPEDTLLIDDCGIFNQPIAMSILKAATWSNAGSNGQRVVGWRSTSDKVVARSVTFSGKIILLTNTLPATSEVEAFLSRTLCLEIELDPDEVAEMLLEAAKQKEFYDDTELATQVATCIIKEYSNREMNRLSLRTLQVAYELARINPETWPDLLGRLLPPATPDQLVRKLSTSSISVEKQASKFTATTGLSRRTFFSYRRDLGLQMNHQEAIAQIQG